MVNKMGEMKAAASVLLMVEMMGFKAAWKKVVK